MSKRLYIGNLPFSATEDVLRTTFEQCGKVESVSIAMDRQSGRSRGFGFVEMSQESEAQAVIEKFNGADYEGRTLTVNIARPREEGGGPRGGGFRGDRGGFRGDRPSGDRGGFRGDRNGGGGGRRFNRDDRGGGGGDRRPSRRYDNES